MPILTVVVLIVVLALLWGLIQDQAERRRVRRVQAKAEELGFSPSEESKSRVLTQTGHFLLYNQGETGSVQHPLAGKFPTAAGPVDVVLFEYVFTIPFGRFTRSWFQTVARLTPALSEAPEASGASRALTLPGFSTMSELSFDRMIENARDKELRERLLETAGARFPDHPSFGEEFHVIAQDRRAVEDLYTDDLIAFHEAHPDLCVEGYGETLLCYHFDQILEPVEIGDFVQASLEVFERYSAASATIGAQQDRATTERRGETR
ncbi:MAG: hypothetical protein ACP5HS_06560 [Anaerolineae bacterium]